MSEKNLIAQALIETLISPNVSDTNMESANLVDVGDRIGDALWKLVRTGDPESVGTLEGLTASIEGGARAIAEALHAVAAALREHGRL
jgi:hypothetical protein